MEDITLDPVPVPRVLQAAEDARLTEVFLLGYLPSGEIYLAASTQDAEILRDLLIEASELTDQLERQQADDDDDPDGLDEDEF